MYPKLVKEIVSKEGVRHFRRWRLFWTPWFAIYLHHIEQSDKDKDPHNHPWNFVSLVLWGGYVETLYDYKERQGWDVRILTRMITSLCYRSRKQFHKFKLICPTWTLVFTGKDYGEWGYNTNSGYVDKDTYRKLKNELRDSTY